MRKAILLALILLLAESAYAQRTSVSATVVDSSGIPYANARVSAQLVPSGGATVNGQQIDGTAFSSLSAAGVLSMDLWSNTSILPANSQWQITTCVTPGVQPPLGTGSQCFTITATITGATQSLTAAMVAAAPALTFLNLTPTPTGFANLTSGTNSTAAMVVGTGASLGVSGAGTINATTLGGATFAAPGAIGSGTPSTGAFTTLTSNGLSASAIVASGTSALGTGAIASATCATVVTTAATGAATTDNLMADFNADPSGTTGYAPASGGTLYIIKYITANNVNFKVCNSTGASITPGAATLQWRVAR